MENRAPTLPAYRGSDRYQPVPSCGVTREHLFRLYQELQRKNDELFDDIARDFKETPERTIEQAKKNLQENLRVTVVAVGTKGEQVVTHDESGLRDENLPASMVSIVLDSAWVLRMLLSGQEPLNRCLVLFDFRKPPLIDLSDPSGEPTANASHFKVVAANATWAAGVVEVITTWLEPKRLQRLWIHKPYTYDALLLLGGIPLALWGAWRANGAWVRGGELERNGVGVLLVIYIFLILLYVFRVLFGAVRWLWPYIEFERPGKGVEKNLRLGLGVVVLGIVSAFLYDVLRVVLGHRG